MINLMNFNVLFFVVTWMMPVYYYTRPIKKKKLKSNMASDVIFQE